MMKKTILFTSFASILAMTNMAHAASKGTLTFSGKLTDQTCSVVLNGSSSASGTVKLPTMPIALLATLNSVAGQTPFTLNLTGCKASTTTFGVTAYFPNNAAYISTRSSTLLNQETGTTAATNVDLELVQIIDGAETKVPLGNAIDQAKDSTTFYKYTTVPINATSATMNYAVRYKNTYNNASTAGLVKGIAIYELAYQ